MKATSLTRWAALAVLARGGHAISDEVLAAWEKATAAAPNLEPFMPPATADEWYTVTIANVSVGYMHTTVGLEAEDSFTTEVMDVQVSRGSDTSRMALRPSSRRCHCRRAVHQRRSLRSSAPVVACVRWRTTSASPTRR